MCCRIFRGSDSTFRASELLVICEDKLGFLADVSENPPIRSRLASCPRSSRIESIGRGDSVGLTVRANFYLAL